MNRNESTYYGEFPDYKILMNKLARENGDKVSYFDFVEELSPRFSVKQK